MDIKEEDILGSSVATHWYYVSKGLAIQKLLRHLSVTNILDVGAGSGVFSKLLLDSNFVHAARCVDTAYKVESITEVHNGKRIDYVQSADRIDEPLILMLDVLEHIDDDLAALRYYVDNMTDGAHVLISVPAFNFLWSGHDIFLEHKRRYTLSGLEQLVRKSGLQVVRSRYFFGLLFPLIALVRLTNNIRLKTGKLSAKSDLSRPNVFLNGLLIAIHKIELNTLFYINKFAGLTVFCLAKKTS